VGPRGARHGLPAGALGSHRKGAGRELETLPVAATWRGKSSHVGRYGSASIYVYR